MSASRSRRSLTGRPVPRAMTAAAAAISAGWVSLPPKPPPMRRHCTVTRLAGTAQRVGDDLLDFRRMLGGAVHQHAAVLLRQGCRNLSLEIEMILAAHRQRAAEAMRGTRQRLLRPAPRQAVAGQHEALGRRARRECPESPAGPGIRPAPARGRAPRPLIAVGRNREQRLADMLHQPRCKDRIIMDRGAVIVLARDILGREHRHDTRRPP